MLLLLLLLLLLKLLLLLSPMLLLLLVWLAAPALQHYSHLHVNAGVYSSCWDIQIAKISCCDPTPSDIADVGAAVAAMVIDGMLPAPQLLSDDCCC